MTYLLLVLGLVLLIAGGELLVRSAVRIAEHLGLSPMLIGLTIVAVGTSAPELVTSVIAALKRQGDVAFGNVVGSNIYNILGIGGTTAYVHYENKETLFLAAVDADLTALFVEFGEALFGIAPTEGPAHRILDAVLSTVADHPLAERLLAGLEPTFTERVLQSEAFGELRRAIAELLRALGAEAPKVIFATGSPNEIPQDIADLGPVLTKPYDFEELVSLARGSAKPSLFARLRR